MQTSVPMCDVEGICRHPKQEVRLRISRAVQKGTDNLQRNTGAEYVSDKLNLLFYN